MHSEVDVANFARVMNIIIRDLIFQAIQLSDTVVILKSDLDM